MVSIICNVLKIFLLALFLFIIFLFLFESLFMSAFLPLYQYIVAAVFLSFISIVLHKNKKTLMALLVLVAVILVPASVNYSGYCLRQNKFVSPEEKIKMAIERIHKWTNNDRHWSLDGQKIELIPYDTAEDILKSNPDCCTYKQTSRTTSGGWNIAKGRVIYETKYKKEDGSIGTTELKGHVYYNNCGVREIVEELRFGND